MEKYNKYTALFSSNDIYLSEIAFVKINDNFKKNFFRSSEYWVTFKNGKQSMFSIDDDLQLFNKKEQFLNRYKEIKDFHRTTRYHTYVKILNDFINPQLNDKIMLFTFGTKIFNILNDNEINAHNKIFNLIIRLTSGFPNYDRSVFTNHDYQVEDKSLNIKDDIIIHPKLDIIKDLEREYKIKKIKNSLKITV
jgi:hypothetical protein